MAAIQCTLACRRGKNNLLKFKPNLGMAKKGDISDSECSRVVGARPAGLSISENGDLLGLSHITISRV